MSAEASSLPMMVSNNAGLRPLLMLVGVAAAVAAGVGVVLWSKEPDYSMLLTKVSNSEIATVVQSLESAGIPYKADTGSGSVSVPAAQLSEARLKLAGEGLPGDGGFAALTKDTGFGTSQLMETTKYHYALELELAKTISSLQSVSAARVHLAIPDQSAFVRDKRKTSASVFVQLKSGRRLESEQVTAVINLIASSVPGMDSTDVTVIDQQGRLLSSPQGDDDFSRRDKQYEFAHRLEETYAQRIEQLLSPLVGNDNVRAQVVADVELSVTEETREQYNPQSQVVRSEQISEQSAGKSTEAQGVPGALSNQPPAAGTVEPPNVATNQIDGVAEMSAAELGPIAKESTRNYEIDRTLAYTKQLPGQLKRLTVAVLVDNLKSTDAEGKVTTTPLTSEQLDNMTRLVKDAVGFDERRGDSVNVINSAFRPIEVQQPGELQSVPIWERSWVRDAAKLLSGLIVLLVLILVVIKPLIRNLMASPAMVALAPGVSQPSVANPQVGTAPVQPKGYEQQIADARSLVNQDPARVAQVVKTWVSDNE
ncbi:MAG: flagellar basal-body MS-ring/collar protein FliF [Steroidobacteraceae bacterium]